MINLNWCMPLSAKVWMVEPHGGSELKDKAIVLEQCVKGDFVVIVEGKEC